MSVGIPTPDDFIKNNKEVHGGPVSHVDLGIQTIQELLDSKAYLSTGQEDGLLLAVRLLKEHKASGQQ